EEILQTIRGVIAGEVTEEPEDVLELTELAEAAPAPEVPAPSSKAAPPPVPPKEDILEDNADILDNIDQVLGTNKDISLGIEASSDDVGDAQDDTVEMAFPA